MSGRLPVEVDTGYRIGGWRLTGEEQGPPPVCELCLANPGADHELAARRVEEADDPAEIAAWWDRARDVSKGVAWRRLVDTAAFGEPTHDIVVVGIESKGKGVSRKVTGLAVRDRTPAWLIKDSVSYEYPGDRGDGRPKLHTGIADAYMTGLRDPNGFDPKGPSFWVPWEWPIEGWSKAIGGPMKTGARGPTAPLRYEKSPLVFAVAPSASPETRKIGFIGYRMHELVLASGVYVQPTDWKQTRDVFQEPTVGTSSRWPVSWRFRYTEVILALAASPG